MIPCSIVVLLVVKFFSSVVVLSVVIELVTGVVVGTAYAI